jgi:hypothetical protein
MNDPQPISPRRRLQALLAIPDSERTEAQWDELNELEIMFAPGNRIDAGGDRNPAERSAGDRGARRSSGGGAKAQPAGAAPQAKKPFRRFHKKPAKPTAPSGE